MLYMVIRYLYKHAFGAQILLDVYFRRIPIFILLSEWQTNSELTQNKANLSSNLRIVNIISDFRIARSWYKNVSVIREENRENWRKKLH
jgi:hypothetical protein